MLKFSGFGGAVWPAVVVALLVALGGPGAGRAEGPLGEPEPVPSLDPAWSASFVPPAAATLRLRAASICIPLDGVFYAGTDWLRLAQKLRANASTCANYYVSVPPLAADKTALRVNQAPAIRALGPQMHAMAEINITGWQAWVAADPGRTWFGAGVEARRRMAAAGFDVNAGDIWAVNEFSSAVRTGAGNARQNMRELVRGLYIGDGTTAVPGLVWTTGIGQPTNTLELYKNNVKLWLGDTPFWDDMNRYVRFFSQEVYGSVANWAVPGTTPQERLGPLVDYLEHYALVAGHGPPEVATGTAHLAQADAPLANAAWPRPGFGWPPLATPTPVDIAQAYVAAQVYALRHAQASRAVQLWGFAWNPTTMAGEPVIVDFVNKTASILDTLAAAIHNSDAPSEDPGSGACGVDYARCRGDLSGASFNNLWHAFNTWSQPVAVDSSATVQQSTPTDVALAASDADGEPLTYTIAGQPAHGAVTGSGPKVTYTPEPGYAGADSFTFFVTDGVMISRTATVSITVNAPPTVTIDASGPIDEAAAPISVSAHAADPEGAPVTLTWTTSVGTIVPAGDTATLAVDDGPAVAHVTVSADDGNGGTATASIDVVVRNLPPSADAGPDAAAAWGAPVTLAGASPTDPSAADTAAGLTTMWAFGDGSTGVGPVATHVYAQPGVYTATLQTRDKDGGESFDTAIVMVGARSSSLANDTPPTLDAATAVASARIGDTFDASSARLAGHRVTLALGSSSCSATTDATGVARCALGGRLPLGPRSITATFDGDALYDPATAVGNVVLYGLPVGGVFAVADRSAAGRVTFWSPAWRSANRLSGGDSPASFKGLTHPAASGWTAQPGFDHAPAGVPEWMGVVVTSTVTKRGDVISGDAVGMVVVHVDAYDPDREGQGTVVADAG